MCDPVTRARPTGWGWSAAATAVAFAAAVTFAVPAYAHEDEAATKASVLVRQAIALIVNTPSDDMGIEDKINDALESKVPEGVDLDVVRQAKQAFASGDMHATRTLLERSIGARPHLSGAMPVPIDQMPGNAASGMTGSVMDTSSGPMQMAVGDEPGNGVADDPLVAQRDLSGRELGALIASLLAIAAGLALAVRFRPPVPLRRLRARGGPGS